MGKILPILLLVMGTAAGFGAGVFMAPDPAECSENADPTSGEPFSEECKAQQSASDDSVENNTEAEGTGAVEFVRMNDQFVVPVLEDGVVKSLVVLSITLEVDTGQTAPIFGIEPKLRDAFLRVLFDHANVGGFNGMYTDASRLEDLRRALLETAIKTAGNVVRNILILDLLRQDV